MLEARVQCVNDSRGTEHGGENPYESKSPVRDTVRWAEELRN